MMGYRPCAFTPLEIGKMQRLLPIAALAMIASVCAPAAAESRGDKWWDKNWRYRLLVEVPGPRLRGGINTARVRLEDLSKDCLPDGRDVRVLTRQGLPVGHRVNQVEGGTLEVLFEVSGEPSRFYVYYANPQAARSERPWNETLGGLTVEVRPVLGKIGAGKVQPNGQPMNRAATGAHVANVLEKELNALQAERELLKTRSRPGRAMREPYGKKPWARIYDLQNPFRDGTHPLQRVGVDDLYLGIYEGAINCPEDGQYTFAANADDASLFSMAIADKLRHLCWRYADTASRNWKDRKHPDGVCVRTLEAGVYRIRYLHGENGGSQLAALGWKLPSGDVIEPVPASAFVKYLPVEIRGRDELGKEFSPFFDALHLFNLQINSVENPFPNYRLRFACGWEDRPDDYAAQLARSGWQWEWDLGDGVKAEGPTVSHEFPALGSYPVRLTVTPHGGTPVAVERTVTPPREPVREMTVQMQVQSESILLGKGQALEMRVLVSARKERPRTFEVRTSRVGPQSDVAAARVDSRLVRITPVPVGQEKDNWQGVDISRDVEGAETQIKVALRLHGVELLAERVTMRACDAVLQGLHLDESLTLRDESGALARLTASELVREQAGARKLVGADGSVRVLVLDELLGGPPGRAPETNYIGALREMLTDRYPPLRFEFRRSATRGDVGSFPVLKLLHVAEAMVESRANLVVLVWPPQAVMDGLPIREFEKYLGASLDQILAHTQAEVIVVSSPPLPGNPELAFEYARAAKSLGLRKDVRVVDLYSRFLLTKQWQSLFRSERGRYPAFLLYPTARGQEEVAREIYATIIDSCHERLSNAVREAMLKRPGSL
jgi:hypothetical protein